MADSLLQHIIENMTNGGICKHFERMCGSGIWGCAILKEFPGSPDFFHPLGDSCVRLQARWRPALEMGARRTEPRVPVS